MVNLSCFFLLWLILYFYFKLPDEEQKSVKIKTSNHAFKQFIYNTATSSL